MSKKKDLKKKPGFSFGKTLRVFYNVLFKYSGLWLLCLSSIIGLIFWAVSKENPFTFPFYSLEQTLFLIFFAVTVLLTLLITLKKLIVNPTKNAIEGFKQADEIKDNQRDMQEPTREYLPQVDSPRKTPKRKKGRRFLTPQDSSEKTPATADRNTDPHYAHPTQPYTPMPPFQPVQPTYYYPPPHFSNSPWQDSQYTSPKEEPKIYLSRKERDTLIHEYSDRFEVYRLVDGKAVRDRVEFKY